MNEEECVNCGAILDEDGYCPLCDFSDFEFYDDEYESEAGDRGE